MGVVLTGRFPAKVQKDGFSDKVRKKLVSIFNGFVTFAHDFGLAAAEQETVLRMDAPGGGIWTRLENYGVAACNMGNGFGKGTV